MNPQHCVKFPKFCCQPYVGRSRPGKNSYPSITLRESKCLTTCIVPLGGLYCGKVGKRFPFFEQQKDDILVAKKNVVKAQHDILPFSIKISLPKTKENIMSEIA